VRVSKLEEYKGRTCSLILGQFTTLLKDKLKHDPDYNTVIDSGKPLSIQEPDTSREDNHGTGRGPVQLCSSA
jgi:hypothetical protein